MTSFKWAVVAAAILSLTTTASTLAQSIAITITDKEGEPRRNLSLEYDISGIDVDRLDAPPVALIAGRDGQTDGNGVLSVDVSELVILLSQYRAQLANSRQIRVELYPLSPTEELASITLDFLLGTEPQDLKVVVMKAPFAEAAERVGRAAYRGRRGTFHLLGQTGTAFFCQPNGKYALNELEFAREDARFLYFREPETARNWAFQHNCRARCAVWICDQSTNWHWRKFDSAKRIAVAQ